MVCVSEMFLVEMAEGFEFLLGSRRCGIEVKHEQKGDVPLTEQILQKQEVRVRMTLEGSVLPDVEWKVNLVILFIHSFIIFNKYLLTAYFVSITVMGTRNISVCIIKFLLLENLQYYPVR